ncbi:MAG: sugar kinase [Elainella sp.]
MATGLFVGLITLDLIYLTPALPQPNQKLVAQAYTLAAGGPATNAAITFQFLASSAQTSSSKQSSLTRLMGVIGNHPVSRFILAELQAQQLELIDLQPDSPEPLPVSSVLVTQATGDRAVISINASRTQADPDQIPEQILSGVEVVLIDGHQMAVGAEIAQRARQASIPVVVDAGSWKPGFEAVLRQADHVICSANFQPPDWQGDPLDYLQSLGVPYSAVTRGEQPIWACSRGERFTVPVPSVSAVDTIGAGDVFHGAFCYYILQLEFRQALEQAAQVAAQSCRSFGTREWMREWIKAAEKPV